MSRIRWRKALPIIWARIAIGNLSAGAITFSTAGYLIGLEERTSPTLADAIVLVVASVSPGLLGLLAAIVLVLPAIVAGVLHFGWGWLLHGLWSRWARPRPLNSLWEGCLSLMVFWAGVSLGLCLALPFAPLDGSPTDAQMEAIAAIAGLVALVSWHGLFLLEILVRGDRQEG